MRLCAWLRSGKGIVWLAAGTIPNSLYRVSLYLFLACALCYCSFFCRFSFCFHALVGALRRCSCDRFLSSRPRTGLATTYVCILFLGMVESRSVNVKNSKGGCLESLDAFSIVWLAAGTIPNSLYRVPLYLFLACALCYCSFFCRFSFCFHALVGAFFA